MAATAAAVQRAAGGAHTVPGPVRGGQTVRDRPAPGTAGPVAAGPATVQPVRPAARPQDAQHAAAAQRHPADQRGRHARTSRGRRVRSDRRRRAAVVQRRRRRGVAARRPPVSPRQFRRVGRQEDGRVRRHGVRVRRRDVRRRNRFAAAGVSGTASGGQRVAGPFADGRSGGRRAHRVETPAAVAAAAAGACGGARRRRVERPARTAQDVLPAAAVARVQLRRRRRPVGQPVVVVRVRELRRPVRGRPTGHAAAAADADDRVPPIRGRRHPQRLRHQLLSVVMPVNVFAASPSHACTHTFFGGRETSKTPSAAANRKTERNAVSKKIKNVHRSQSLRTNSSGRKRAYRIVTTAAVGRSSSHPPPSKKKQGTRNKVNPSARLPRLHRARHTCVPAAQQHH